MRIIRIYQASPLSVDKTLLLEETTWRHVCQVLRLKVGDAFILFNGDGHDYHAQLTQVDKRHAKALITDKKIKHHESPLLIHLGQGISRSDRMDYAIQKSVELGVNEITPLLTDYSEAYSTERLTKRQQHWQQIAISACEQSGRAVIPVVHTPIPLAIWVTNLTSDHLKLILSPRANAMNNTLTCPTQRLTMAIGPEGGFSDDEILHAQQEGFDAIALGPRILRTETATSAAITVAQWLWGDFNRQE